MAEEQIPTEPFQEEVNAQVVNISQGGAGHVDAESVSIRQGGAQTIASGLCGQWVPLLKP